MLQRLTGCLDSLIGLYSAVKEGKEIWWLFSFRRTPRLERPYCCSVLMLTYRYIIYNYIFVYMSQCMHIPYWYVNILYNMYIYIYIYILAWIWNVTSRKAPGTRPCSGSDGTKPVPPAKRKGIWRCMGQPKKKNGSIPREAQWPRSKPSNLLWCLLNPSLRIPLSLPDVSGECLDAQDFEKRNWE